MTDQIDVSPIVDDYHSDKDGQPPFHPRMMLVLYAYSQGVFSSRKIMTRCATDVAFRVIVGEGIPNFRRIAEFRSRHLQHLQALFLEVLVLCREAGLLQVGRLSLDGTKIKANAAHQKARDHIDKMETEGRRHRRRIRRHGSAEARRSGSEISQGSPTEEPDAETEDGSS